MATKAIQPTETRPTVSKRIRKIFGNIHEVSEMPNLIEVQRESYEQFLRSRPQDGYVSGLEKTLRSVFPIRDFAGTAELDFVHYELEDPKYDVDECRQRGMTYASSATSTKSCEMPNLIEVQRESYEQFLRSRPQDGYVSGLEKTLRSVFPIRDFAGTAELDFVHYELEDPKYDTDECRQRGMTYAAPMRVTLRLIVFEVDPDTETRSVLDIKEQDVYMGDMPLMTKNGTFIVNGTERVIVSQMHRSPGVLFDHDRGKTHASGKYLFAARVIPYRGSWLDFEFDAKDIVNVRIDRKRKLPVTALLHALGLIERGDPQHLLRPRHLRARHERLAGPLRRRAMARPEADLRHRRRQDRARSSSRPARRSARAPPTRRPRTASTQLLIPTEEIFGRYSAYDLVNDKTGEIYIEAGDEVSPENLEKLDKAGIDRIELLDIDHVNTGAWIRNTLKADKAEDRDQAPGRHLPRHAPRRAADARDRRGPVRRPVLRSRALRPLGRRPRQAQHAPRPRRRGHGDHAAQGGHRRGGRRPWSTSRTARARSTTSTISATAACARSASCSRTSIASACSAWSAR